MQKNLVTCENLIKIYKTDDIEVIALQGLDLEVTSGEMIALVGASGSGKTTLMNILGGLDIPSAGRASIAEFDLTRLNEEQRTRYRNLVIGYMWQQSGRNLLPDLTAAANIDLPQILNGAGRARSTKRTQELLALVGLADMAKKKPAQLSGGEQQRIAIAVALANSPILLLADEPTGELDSVTAREIIACLRQINEQLSLTIILVTHDVAVASEVDRTLAIRDGRTSTETIRRNKPLSEIGFNGSGETGTSTAIGLSLEDHSESVFIDRIGILQLPKDATERIIMDGRADVSIADDHVELWPIDTLDDPRVDALSPGKSAVIGLSLHTHCESILVDRAGRLQLPREALEHISFHGRAQVKVIDNRIELWPVGPDNEPQEGRL